jgi:hypothetical protein
MSDVDPDLLVRRFVDGDLSAAETQRALHRIADDPEARELLRFELHMAQDLAASASAAPPPTFADDTMARLSDAPAAASAPSLGERLAAWWRSATAPVALEVRPLAAALAALLLAVGAWIAWPTAPAPSTETASTAPEQRAPSTASSSTQRASTASSNGDTVWIRFLYTNSAADSVAVAGDFNQWDPVPLSPRTVNGETVWTGLVPVSRGENDYQFVMTRGAWVTDPPAPGARGLAFGADKAVLAIWGSCGFPRRPHRWASRNGPALMWRLIVLIGLLIGIGTGPSGAQEWSGSAALGLSGGHQTNLYLDPVLGTWNPDVQTFFLGATPQLGLTRSASRTRIDLTVRGRLNPRRDDAPQLAQSSLRGRYRLGPDWTLGLVGGGTRYRYPAFREAVGTARDSWWVLPALQWTPTAETMLTLRTGLIQRFERLPTLVDRQTSGLVSLRATRWLTDRVQGEAQVHYSDGRTSTAETGFGGSGGTLAATYWPTDAVSVRGAVALEQLRYETLQPSGTARDRLGRAGVTVEWTPRSALTLFGRARALTADLGSGSPRTDAHVSAGVRLQTRQVLGGSVEPPSRRRVCENVDGGLRVRVPYEGKGTPHVTGDFNSWSLPGVPLRPTGDGLWETTLDLPAGRYAYRLRVVRDGSGRWLDLPSYARTAEDPFGGTNGVCTVQ